LVFQNFVFVGLNELVFGKGISCKLVWDDD